MPTYAPVQRTFGAMRPVARGPNVEAQIEDDARAILAMQQKQAADEAKRAADAAYRGTNVALRTTSVQNAKAYQDAMLRQREDALRAMASVREANLAKTRLSTSRMQDEDARHLAAAQRLRIADALEKPDDFAYSKEIAILQQKRPDLLKLTPEQRKALAESMRKEAASFFPQKAIEMQHAAAMQARREAAAKAEEDRKNAAKVTPLQEKAKVIAALQPISPWLRLTPQTDIEGKIIPGTAAKTENVAALVQAMREGASLPEAADAASIDFKPSEQTLAAKQALDIAKAAADHWYSTQADKDNLKTAQEAYDAAANNDAETLNSFVWDEASGRIVDRRALTPAPNGGIPSGVSSTVRDVVGSRTAMKQEQAAAQAEARRPATPAEEYDDVVSWVNQGLHPKTRQSLTPSDKIKWDYIIKNMQRTLLPPQQK